MYKCTLTFSFTDSTYQFKLDNVYCSESYNVISSANSELYREIEPINPFDNECPTLNMWAMHPPCEKTKEMMKHLKSELNLLFTHISLATF